ncbi:hypothetical protein Ate01nite_35140 [Actinoplanes teichomyceticus]|nr:hypothetical protein Ate01nite_35140 [Actinoplanes teichomyceticus]
MTPDGGSERAATSARPDSGTSSTQAPELDFGNHEGMNPASLGTLLRQWRDRLQPSDAGITAGPLACGEKSWRS